MKRRLQYRRAFRNGSALILTLILTLCLTVVAAAALSRSVLARRLDVRRAYARAASNALEATLNYAAAQVINRLKAYRYYDEDLLVNSALAAPPKDFFTVDKTIDTDGSITIDPATNIMLRAGRAYTPSRAYLAEDGPAKSQYVTSKMFPILASVTVPVPGGAPITVLGEIFVTVYDASFSNYAIFYNTIPLEIAPGGDLNINGPIRANSNIYYGGAYAQLTVQGSIFSSGKIIQDRDPNTTITTGNAKGRLNVGFKDVNRNGAYEATTTPWTYDGTKSGSAAFFDPTAGKAELISTYIKNSSGDQISLDNSVNNPDWQKLATTVTNGNMQDSAHGVQPIIPAGLPDAATAGELIRPPLAKTAAGYKSTVETQKYGTQAGLYIVVEPEGYVTGFTNATDAIAYKAQANSNTTEQRKLRTTWKTNNPTKYLTVPSAVITQTTSTATTTSTTTSVMYDAREKLNISVVDLDMGKLRDVVTGTATMKRGDATDYPVKATPDAFSPGYSTEGSGWNGVVYVDVENPNSGWSTKTVTTAATRTAVRLVNAQTVPDRTQTDSTSPFRGVTIATNAPIYTKGNVNADGVLTTGSNANPDKATGGTETVMSIAADAITVLSSNWSDASSIARVNKPAPVTTEISSALFVGVLDSAKGKASYSGGVQNLPRLLEGWSGHTLRIRGSIIAMYESRYAIGPWGGSYYGVPTRDWGLSSFFSNGSPPPGAPIIRSYRTNGFRLLSAAEYRGELASNWNAYYGSTRPNVIKFPPP